jgi:hypothetical protein
MFSEKVFHNVVWKSFANPNTVHAESPINDPTLPSSLAYGAPQILHRGILVPLCPEEGSNRPVIPDNHVPPFTFRASSFEVSEKI